MSVPTSMPTSAVRGYRASRAPLASTSLDLLDRSRASLLQACRTGDAGERYVEAHLGALRAAAALLAARSIPSGAGPSGAGRSGGAGGAGRPVPGHRAQGRPVRGGPSEPVRPARGRAACGSCCRAWRPSSPSGRRSSRPRPVAGRRSSEGAGSPAASPTTCCARRRTSSRSSRTSSACRGTPRWRRSPATSHRCPAPERCQAWARLGRFGRRGARGVGGIGGGGRSWDVTTPTGRERT